MSENIKWEEQGDANEYAVVSDNNWFASIRFNGQISNAKQEAVLNNLINAISNLDIKLLSTPSLTNDINLRDYLSEDTNALIGRESAVQLLKRLKSANIDLDELEEKPFRIEITIPDSIVTVSVSFIKGLFESRVMKLGYDGFKNKYKFIADKYILNKIEEAISTIPVGDIH